MPEDEPSKPPLCDCPEGAGLKHRHHVGPDGEPRLSIPWPTDETMEDW